MKRRACPIAGALCAALPLLASAQAGGDAQAAATHHAIAADAKDGGGEAWAWQGTASLGAVWASGSRDLDDAGPRTGLAARARLEGRRGAVRTLLDTGGGTHPLGHDDAYFLRQAFVEFGHGSWQWRIGRQIHAWGRADRINPTDNLGVRNPRALVTDIDEERRGVDGLSLRRTLGPHWSMTLVSVPRLPATPLPRAVAFDWPQREHHGPTHALRADYSGEGLDMAVSVLEGEALLPAAESLSGTAGAQWRQPRVRVWGADVSRPLGAAWGLRGEWADTGFLVPPPPGLRSQQFAVLGLERHFGAGWLGVAQWVHRRVRGAGGPVDSPLAPLNRLLWGQAEPRSDALYLGLTRSAMETDLSGDVGVLQSLDHASRGWFAQIQYRIDDRWDLRGRWQHFDGPPASQLGALRRDRLLLLELRAQLTAAP